MKILGIDGGYSTMGMVLLESHQDGRPLDVIRAKSISRKKQGKSFSFAEAAARSNDMMRHLIDFIAGEPLDVVAWETWAGSQHAWTSYCRGVYDGMIQQWFTALATYRPNLIFTFHPNAVKSMLHPTGKAVDSGRTKDLEFQAALVELRTGVRNVDAVANPDFYADGAKRWKQARVHALDAAALGWLAALAANYRDFTLGPEAPPHRDHHLKLLMKLAQKQQGP